MKTNALKSSLLLRVLSVILLLLTTSLWSCEHFDKHKDPEPKPVPLPEPAPKPVPAPKPDSIPVPAPKPDSIPVPPPTPPADSIPVPNPTPKPDSIPQPTPAPQPGPSPQPAPNPNPQPTPSPNPGPVSKVPADVVGKWNGGHFSWGEFWTQDGSYSGNAVEVGIAFDFKADGTCEFYFVTGGTSFGCRTEAFVYEKGTVAFSGNAFTFTPTEGSARGFYKGCASSYKNYNKKHTPDQLKPTTYYYALEKDSQGNNQLIIRFKPDAQNYTTFYRANW
ncbi:MAG TPA: hypothetical protein VF646_07275 [Cytophagales bacterium]